MQLKSPWEEHPKYQVQSSVAGRVSYDELVSELQRLQSQHASQFKLCALASSVEGRTIYRVDVGRGATRVVLWSQMHGDEPTHTVVLLELLRALLSATSSDWARTILEKCSLTVVPMLNPDGAVRWTRFNAQTIDVNRDARRLATPEGAALYHLIRREPFDFAFNLHNQSRYSTVDGKHLAAVSLLVPPIDEQDTETPWVRRAKSVAGQFTRAVRPYCDSLISRYDAGYMPRCFGEWVQSEKISTLLVEAGGSPHSDQTWLTRAHFTGLVAALNAIASDQLSDDFVSDYLSLRRSVSDRSFDLVIREVYLTSSAENDGKGRIDLGVSIETDSDETIGTIQELGDLQDVSGLTDYEFKGDRCIAGRVCLLPNLRPSEIYNHKRFNDLVAIGVTTVLGLVSLEDGPQLRMLSDLDHREATLPLNVAFLGQLRDENSSHSSTDINHRLLVAEGAAAGICGILRTNFDPTIEAFAHALNVACVNLPCDDLPGKLHVVDETTVQKLLPTRGSVSRGAIADLVLFDSTVVLEENFATSADRARCVWINGIAAFLDGQGLNTRPGRVLKRNCEDRHAK